MGSLKICSIGLIVLLLAWGYSAVWAGTPAKEVSVEDIRKETKQLIEVLKTYSVQQKEEAVEQTGTALRKLDGRIEALERDMADQWDGLTKAGREKSQATLRALRRQRIEIAEWYGSLKSDTGSAWEEIKHGFSDAYSAINKALGDAREEFGQETRK